MAIDKTHWDTAMHYEELAKAVFDCDRYEDPWGYASADQASYFANPGEEAKMRLYTIIDVAVYDNQGEDVVATLLKVKERVAKMKTNDEAIKIIHDLIDIMNFQGY
ncbi:MAG: hypothetical protein V4635_15580 [Bacteroidota bacterium]